MLLLLMMMIKINAYYTSILLFSSSFGPPSPPITSLYISILKKSVQSPSLSIRYSKTQVKVNAKACFMSISLTLWCDNIL